MIHKDYNSIGTHMGYGYIEFRNIINNRFHNNILVWVLREVIFRCSGNIGSDVIDECYILLATMLDNSSRGGRIIENMYLDNLISFSNPIINHLVKQHFDSNPRGLKLHRDYKVE